MKSLRVKNILKEGAESKMDEQRKQEIDTIHLHKAKKAKGEKK